MISVFRYIKQAAQKIQDEYEGEIPKTVEGLCSLPGVGPKMAFLALQVQSVLATDKIMVYC